ncbi:MAG: tetratricopeptide repeat protein [Betaproteobacteria bacterium]|nr:tetratricopeptide repeat protein [Betaproteobacteria bacterium]
MHKKLFAPLVGIFSLLWGAGALADAHAPSATALEMAAYNGNAQALIQLLVLGQNHDAQADTALGTLYYLGAGPAHQSYTAAFKWFHRAAQLNDPRGAFCLGVLYGNGQGTKQNMAEAAKWFARAAGRGDAQPDFYLGLLYQNGQGVPRDYATAARWYQKAATEPHNAGFSPRFIYDATEGVPFDNAQVMWFHISKPIGEAGAEEGRAGAEYNLGLMYLTGKGVARDRVGAYQWFSLAADGGNHLAVDNMKILARRMSSGEIVRAQAQARLVAAKVPRS